MGALSGRSLFVSSGFFRGAAGAAGVVGDNSVLPGLWFALGPRVTFSEVPGARVSPAALDVRVALTVLPVLLARRRRRVAD